MKTLITADDFAAMDEIQREKNDVRYTRMDVPAQGNAKHTPGPWGRNIKPARKYCVIFAGRNTHVARVIGDGLTDEEIEGNCDLIAAAPELLAAAEHILAILQHPTRSVTALDATKLEDAVKQAKGGSL